MKIFYLCYFGASGVYFPYAGLYLGAIGLSGSQIGLIASTVPLAGVLLQPLWGLLSDRYGWRKRLLTTALLASALTAPLVALAHSFALLLLPIALLAVALSPTIPLADATTLQWLRRNGGSYGAVRIYGSFGFMLTALATGSFFVGTGILRLFPLYGLLLGVTFAVSLAAPGQGDAGMLRRGSSGMGSLLRDRALVLFLALCFAAYATYAAYNTFFGLYLRDLGAGTGVVGIAAGLASLSELPVMAVAGLAMRRLGVKPVLLIGLGAALVRWLAYAVLRDYHAALVFQALHGLSFAAFYVAGITFIDRRVPANLRATGQTLFYGATFGLGTCLGTDIFGVLYQRLHAAGMFLVAGLVCAVAIVGLLLVMPHTDMAQCVVFPTT